MDKKTVINSTQAPAPIGPYSQAVKAAGLLFVSGQVAIEPKTGELVDQNIEAETHQVMKNIGAILTAAGADFHQILKCSIFVSDMNDFARINEVYGTYFDDQPPARETVEVSRLPKDVGVEVSCIVQL
ncbi:MAG: RidA family protein [Cyclobacteriaceae bacterium]|nr:RidA family protein [Cyclobacteriaceae bacterium]